MQLKLRDLFGSHLHNSECCGVSMLAANRRSRILQNDQGNQKEVLKKKEIELKVSKNRNPREGATVHLHGTESITRGAMG